MSVPITVEERGLLFDFLVDTLTTRFLGFFEDAEFPSTESVRYHIKGSHGIKPPPEAKWVVLREREKVQLQSEDGSVLREYPRDYEDVGLETAVNELNLSVQSGMERLRYEYLYGRGKKEK